MVMAASGGSADQDVMQFAANLTIDNEEYEQFGKEQPKAVKTKKLPVHATTQEEASQANFEAAANRNSFEMLSMFGSNVEKGKPGQ